MYKKKENLKSFLAMPVIHKNLEGVLVIDSKESYCFPTKTTKNNSRTWKPNGLGTRSRKKKIPCSILQTEFIFRDLISYSRFIAESPSKNKAM